MYKHLNKIIVTLAALSITACSADNMEKAEQTLKADILVTEYGIPHITADDYRSLGFGEGYMAAQDHVCNISYSVMMADGELAKYLGAGEKNQYIMQDIVTIGLDIPSISNAAFVGLSTEIKDMFDGYAAGFNKYINENEITSWCSGADWVKPVTGEQVFNRAQFITQTLPRMAPALYMSTPPESGGEQAKLSEMDNNLLLAAAEAIRLKGLGSNAWAIGKDLSEKGRGMLLANPHYPWFGTNRFWEKQLTVPGSMDIYGVSLIGIPGVLIGFNKDIGWSHTVSDSQRLTMYKLELSKDNPT